MRKAATSTPRLRFKLKMDSIVSMPRSVLEGMMYQVVPDHLLHPCWRFCNAVTRFRYSSCGVPGLPGIRRFHADVMDSFADQPATLTMQPTVVVVRFSVPRLWRGPDPTGPDARARAFPGSSSPWTRRGQGYPPGCRRCATVRPRNIAHVLEGRIEHGVADSDMVGQCRQESSTPSLA
jgi:hypothetical protein